MSKQPEARNFHARMMNIRADRPSETECGKSIDRAYKIGHRDARHAAAEIAIEADEALRRLHSVNADLLEALRNFVDFPSDMFDGDHDAPFTMTVRIANMRLARAAIAKAEEA